MTLDDLPAASRAPVEALLGRLKHDLGKYVSLQARWLAPDADRDARRDALTADLLRTRRGPDGHEGAHGVWGPFFEVLRGESEVAPGIVVVLVDDPDVARVTDAMERLAPVASALESGAELDDDVLEQSLTLCRDVADACRDLVRRVREGRPA